MSSQTKPWRLIGIVVVATSLVAVFLLMRGTAGESQKRVPDQVNGAPRLVAVDEHGAIIQTPDKTWGVARQGGHVAWQIAARDFLPLLASCLPACPSGILSANTHGLDSPLAPDPAPVLEAATIPQVMSEPTGGKVMLFGMARDAGLRYSTDAGGAAHWDSLRLGRLRRYPAALGYVDWFPTPDGTAAVTAVDSAAGRDQQLWVNDDGWIPYGRPTRTEAGFGCTSSHGRYALLDGARLVRRDQSPVALSPKPKWSNCAFTKNRVVVAAYSMTDGTSSTTIDVYGLDGRKVGSTRLKAEYFLIADTAGATFALIGSSQVQVRDSAGQLVDTIPDVRDARYDGSGELVVVDSAANVRWVRSRRR
ncbi:MAG: hypothetical protein QM655_07870 [Nocardioidaceae bacterium]